MNTRQMYSAGDIDKLVMILKSGGDLAEAEIAGMEKLVALLQKLETMSEADIEAEVRRLWRSL